MLHPIPRPAPASRFPVYRRRRTFTHPLITIPHSTPINYNQQKLSPTDILRTLRRVLNVLYGFHQILKPVAVR